MDKRSSPTLFEKAISSAIATIFLCYAVFGIAQGQIHALPSARGGADNSGLLLKGLPAYIYCAGLIIGAAASLCWIHPRMFANQKWMMISMAACVFLAAIIHFKFK